MELGGGSDDEFYDVNDNEDVGVQVIASPSLTGEVYGLHRAAFENDAARLAALLQQLPASEHTLQDPHGNNPLHVAALRGNCEAIKVLLDAGLNPTTKSHRGWTPLHEALAARAMPAAKLLHRKIEDNTAAKIRARREQLLETMKEMPDYSLQLKWSIGSSFPGLSLLLRKIAPHDTYTIWKKGDKLRVDGQLIGLDTKNMMPAWKRGHFSLLLDGSPEGRAAAASASAEALAEIKAAAERKRRAKQQKPSRRHWVNAQLQQQQQDQQGLQEQTGVSSSGSTEQQEQEQQFHDPSEAEAPASSSSSSADGLSATATAAGPSSSSSPLASPAASSSSPAGAPSGLNSPDTSRTASPDVGAPQLLFVRHFKESYIDLSADLSGYRPENEEYEQHVDDALMMQMEGGIGKERLKARDFKFAPVKSWLGGNQTEKVEGWKCTVYEATGKLLNYSKSKARLQLPKDATFYDYLSADYAQDEVTETLIDPLSVEGVNAMGKDSSSHSKKGHSTSGGSSSFGGGAESGMFGDADPDYNEMSNLMWNESSSSKTKSKSKSLKSPFGKSSKSGAADGATGETEDPNTSSSSGRVMRARCWMAQDFPMKLNQLLPLLDVIGTANKHMEKVSKFLSKYSEMDMFPVKLQAPLILTIYVLISFKQFHPLVPGTSHPPPAEDFFAVPSRYKRRRLEDALDKAAMGMMRMGGSSRGDEYGGDDYFFGGDPGEDVMLAELDAMMNDEVEALESEMQGLELNPDQDSQGIKSGLNPSLHASSSGRGSWDGDNNISRDGSDKPSTSPSGRVSPGVSSNSSSRPGSRLGDEGSSSHGKKKVSFRDRSEVVVGSRLDADMAEYSRVSSPGSGS